MIGLLRKLLAWTPVAEPEEEAGCTHPRAVDGSSHGMTQRRRYCPDCEVEWVEDS